MATLQGKAVKNTYRQVLQIGANNVGVSGTLQPVQDGTGTNTALSLSTAAATINGTLTITGDLIITGGGIQIQDLIDDTVASLIQNGTGITWAYNDTLRTLTPTITIATADGGVQGDFMQFNVNAGEASAVGKLKWNTTDGTLDLGLMGGQVTLQIGQEQVARVVNNSGTILTEAGYQVVKIASAQGQRLAVNLAQANNDANSVDTLGLVTENIANNQEGYITTSGLVRGIDTTGDLQLEDWNDGDVLYLSPTTPGAITKVKPIAPNHTIIVGYVIYAHKNNGQIFVKVDNGYELDELHNVRITSVANNNVLRYNSSLAVWENVAPLTTWITEGTNLYYTQGRFDSAFAAKSTTNLAEGTNLYFTTARGNDNFATNLAASTTTNLAEGTNLYFTNQRFDSRFGTKTTTDLAEGTNLYYTQARFNTAFDAKTTTDLDEGTNLYYTDARARAAISENAVGLDYSSGSGVLSLTAGYAIPTTVKLGDYDTAYNRSIVSAAVTGTGTKTLSLTQQDANVITATWTDQGITTINGTANQIAATTVGNTTTLAFTNDVTMPNNLVVSGNLTINGTATYVNTQAISAKDPLFEVANDNNTTDAVDIGYYGRYFDSAQTRVEFTGLFRDASDAGKFKFFTGLTVEPTNVVDTTGTGYTVGTLVANVEGNLAGTANAANVLSTARSISATGDAAWTVNFDGSANATGALTLANTGVTATTYGTSTAVPTIAIDSKGRITSASNTNITFPVTTVNSLSGNVVLTTSNVAEGTNQYFTSARAQASITGGASSVVTADLTASRALVSDGTGKIAASASTTATELSYVAGVTSAIQTQLNSKLNLSGGTLTGTLNGTILTASSYFKSDYYRDSRAETLLIYAGSNQIRLGSGDASDYLTFYAGGTQRLTIASTGAATFSNELTIGSPTSNATLNLSGDNGGGLTYINFKADSGATKVQIQGEKYAGTGGILTFKTLRSSVLTTAMVINQDGNVGIGMSSPANLLDIATPITNAFYGLNLNYNGGSVGIFQVNNATGELKVGGNSAGYFPTFYAGGSERIRITSGGDLMVGNGTAAARLHVYTGDAGTVTSQGGTVAIFENGAHTRLQIQSPDTYSPQIYFSSPSYPNSGSIDQYCAAVGVAYMGFNQGGSERMRITGNGFTKASNSGTYVNSSGSYHELRNNAEGNQVATFSTSASIAYGIQISYTNSSPNITSQEFIYCSDSSLSRFIVWSNGSVVNRTGSYGTISDAKYKENIIDATPKLADLMQLKVRNFNMIGDETKQIGFIAQEFEEVFPKMVDTSIDKESGDEYKSIKTSVLLPMLVKAMQEQQAQIEELKALIAAK